MNNNNKMQKNTHFTGFHSTQNATDHIYVKESKSSIFYFVLYLYFIRKNIFIIFEIRYFCVNKRISTS